MNPTHELYIKIIALLGVFFGAVFGGLLESDANTAVVLLVGQVLGGILATLPNTINRMNKEE